MICTRAHCHNHAEPPYRRCDRCRRYQREYMRSVRPPTRRRRDRALEWLRVPRTSAQIAELLCITPQHAAVLIYQLRQRGLVAPLGRVYRGRRDCRYRVV